MRRGFVILGLGLAAAVVAYCGLYRLGTTGPRTWLQSRQPELVWLKQEFKLSDAEFTRVRQLHESYLPKCRERCLRIQALNQELSELLAKSAAVTPVVESVLGDRAKMRAECEAEMLRHFFAVSRSMPPEQGRRYLAWVQEQTCLRDQMMDNGTTLHAEDGNRTGN